MSEENKSDWVEPCTEESVALLKSGSEGVMKFNAMRGEHPDWKPDFSGQDFSDCDLSDAWFENLTFHGADFIRSKVIDVSFVNADLSYANFAEADLSLTKFHKARLDHVCFSDADLQCAEFQGAETEAVNWWTANIRSTRGLSREDIEIVLATIRASAL